jgi:osomolarity two-component system sensor histidine kinase NIK1
MAFARPVKSLTRNAEVNMSQDQELLKALTALKNGDFSVRMSTGHGGIDDEIAQTFNDMTDQLNVFASEVIRVTNEVGIQGKLGGQADWEDAKGKWREITETVNMMAGNLTWQLRTIAEACWSLAEGKPTKEPYTPAMGEVSELMQLLRRVVRQHGVTKEKV